MFAVYQIVVLKMLSGFDVLCRFISRHINIKVPVISLYLSCYIDYFCVLVNKLTDRETGNSPSLPIL